jgi:hypothetical protein
MGIERRTVRKTKGRRRREVVGKKYKNKTKKMKKNTQKKKIKMLNFLINEVAD